jgi:hypothetical protein
LGLPLDADGRRNTFNALEKRLGHVVGAEEGGLGTTGWRSVAGRAGEGGGVAVVCGEGRVRNSIEGEKTECEVAGAERGEKRRRDALEMQAAWLGCVEDGS